MQTYEEKLTRGEIIKLVLFVGIATVAIVVFAYFVATNELRSKQEQGEVSAGQYVSTTLNGSEGSSGVGLGMSMAGHVGVGLVSTSSNLLSLVQTSTQTFTVNGAFNARIGEALLLVTAQDGTRWLCPSTKQGCHTVTDLKD